MNYWKEIKLYRKLLIRFLRDIQTGDKFHFSHKSDSAVKLEHFISISQEIKQNETFESKLYNFSIAAQRINSHILNPNEIFSFWNVIGNPNGQFKNGRTIQNGKITEDVGGGLCQVSGILHQVSLIAGLKILERYNHSVDIYNDETRFCPLGTDATIVYGYKDLRIVNSNPFPIKFEIEVHDKSIMVKLLSPVKIEEKSLEFKTEQQNKYTIVTISDNSKEVINVSTYKNI